MKKGASPSSSSSPSGAGGQGHRLSLAHNMSSSRAHKASDDPAKIFKLIDDNVIGKSAVFLGPYGRRKGESWSCPQGLVCECYIILEAQLDTIAVRLIISRVSQTIQEDEVKWRVRSDV